MVTLASFETSSDHQQSLHKDVNTADHDLRFRRSPASYPGPGNAPRLLPLFDQLDAVQMMLLACLQARPSLDAASVVRTATSFYRNIVTGSWHEEA